MEAILLIVSLTLFSAALLRATPSTEELEFFEQRVRPVLSENCFACHTESKMGGLRVDSREGLLEGGKSGPAIIPRQPADSLLIKAIKQSGHLKMPMGGRLTDAEIKALSDWIKAGAPWPEGTPARTEARIEVGEEIERRAFWSFQPLKDVTPPAVQDESWAKSPVDRFVLSRLEEKGLKPAPAADRATLLRRATFDLTGLPPTPDEIQQFLLNESPDGFAAAVDRLLASPHYGEKWARHWLDVAHYADDDMRGVSRVEFPNAFRYRDWVVSAFNRDLPYDVFVKAQIAGDIMDKELEATSATTYRLTPGTAFFGLGPYYYDMSHPVKTHADERDARVDLLTRGFLGLTVACARCHDHKYDPFSMKDYYGLTGVFANTEYHEYPLAPGSEVKKWKEYDDRIKQLKEELRRYSEAQARSLAEIFAFQTSRYMKAVWEIITQPTLVLDDYADREGLDREILERWTKYLGKSEYDHSYLDAWRGLHAKVAPDDGEVPRIAEDFQMRVLEVFRAKREIDDRNAPLISVAARARAKRQDGVFLQNRFKTYDDFVPNADLDLEVLEGDQLYLWRDLMGEKRSSAGTAYQEIAVLYHHGEWKRHMASLQRQIELLEQSKAERYAYFHGIREIDGPGDIKVDLRGDPTNLGETAPRRFLRVLSPKDATPFRLGSGRMELAEAVAGHPLAARVIVNRVWQHLFGRALLDTPSNFGQVGSRPTHPGLLEYLATRLVRNDWSLKALQREIMLSSVYQLGAGSSQENYEIDPDNKLLWRARVRRLEGEAIRDSLLSAAGNLDLSVGGPSQARTSEHNRRTLYTKVSRRELDEMLSVFDFPDPVQTCAVRIQTNTPQQRLYFLNSEFVWEQARLLAHRLAADIGDDDAAKIHKAYLLLYGREATRSELRLALEFLSRTDESTPDKKSARWSHLAHVLLAANEFIFLQ